MTQRFGELSATVVDELGVAATYFFPIQIDDSQTVITLQDNAISHLLHLDAITGGVVTSIRVSIKPNPADFAFKTTAATGSRVEQTALFNFNVFGSAHRWGADVPAILDSLIVGGKVDLTAAAVIAFLGDITAGLVAISKFLSGFGNVVTSLRDVLLTFRKHRKQESRRSVEL